MGIHLLRSQLKLLFKINALKNHLPNQQNHQNDLNNLVRAIINIIYHIINMVTEIYGE